jgi:bifunctional oligoribonuclease and PAP phosphatase NrnA
VSLRSRGGIDVSVIARKSNGGGHKQAAGFSHPGTVEEIREFIVAEVSAQLAATAA